MEDGIGVQWGGVGWGTLKGGVNGDCGGGGRESLTDGVVWCDVVCVRVRVCIAFVCCRCVSLHCKTISAHFFAVLLCLRVAA